MNYSIDLQSLLVEVGAVKQNDLRVLRSEQTENGQWPSDLQRSDVSANADDDDDWD